MIAKSDPNRSARQPLHDKCLPRATSCVSSRARGQPDEETVIPGIDTQYPIKSHKCEDIKAYIEDDFAEEIEKTATISDLSPDLGQQTRAVLEARKAFCLANLAEAFAGYAIAATAHNAASAGEDDPVTAICAHRCATIEETANQAASCASPSIMFR